MTLHTQWQHKLAPPSDPTHLVKCLCGSQDSAISTHNLDRINSSLVPKQEHSFKSRRFPLTAHYSRADGFWLISSGQSLHCLSTLAALFQHTHTHTAAWPIDTVLTSPVTYTISQPSIHVSVGSSCKMNP